MDPGTPDDVSEVLRSRSGILLALSVADRTPSELTEALSVSRSTVDRGIRDLERVGFLEVDDGTARVTLSGRLAIETYTQFVDHLDDVATATAAFEGMATDAAFDPTIVDGSQVVAADGPDDDRPFERLVAVLDRAESIRGCVREASEDLLELYYRRLHDGDVTVDLVATEDLVERLVTTYRSQLVELLEFQSFSLRSTDSLPYTLLVVDVPEGPLALLATYSSGRLVGVVTNDSPQAVTWASAQIDDCRGGSERLPVSRNTETHSTDAETHSTDE